MCVERGPRQQEANQQSATIHGPNKAPTPGPQLHTSVSTALANTELTVTPDLGLPGTALNPV